MKMLSVHGTAAVAAYGAAQRVESILILVLISLSSALTPFMSQNFGAKQADRSLQDCSSACAFRCYFNCWSL
ncbi:MATE family of MDR efflux pumps [Vibrio variabilis]|uniref:MATE family of MDR efflux pumps n=1 Tax=Vibrio variabilis TaxID=990271 RepID=A0ABQ0JJ21_9VIBR|nr:MATE family of MDR efflux pumps [Vibrio variabilis]